VLEEEPDPFSWELDLLLAWDAPPSVPVIHDSVIVSVSGSGIKSCPELPGVVAVQPFSILLLKVLVEDVLFDQLLLEDVLCTELVERWHRTDVRVRRIDKLLLPREELLEVSELAEFRSRQDNVNYRVKSMSNVEIC
jgi:hypothetical protein